MNNLVTIEYNQTAQVKLGGVKLILSADKAIYLPDSEQLIVADLHLGKLGHFRKHGIPVPTDADADTYQNLDRVIGKFNPKEVVILGDMFHAEYNSEIDRFKTWAEQYNQLKFTLVKGNHDKLTSQQYISLGIKTVDYLMVHGLLLVHEPNLAADIFGKIAADQNQTQLVCGHLHPAIKLTGKGGQSVKLPAFCLTNEALILPTFGKHTGLKKLKAQELRTAWACDPT